ncbi:uncharacterized protein TrAFT101_008021 [Trichoderma asperellum]|uniref:uncharacterized protein n=1 Tax=Trichoderma asperellum TaxID=101201 RepID=UPI0033179E5E|nr:hypothetical protein TrAFT101_008021 [Trichoderma asperellum]
MLGPRCDMTQIVLSGLENWKRGEGLPGPWKNANIQLLERLVNANVKRRNRIFFATERMRNVKARQPENKQNLAMVHYPDEHDHYHAVQMANTADFFNSIALGQESLVRDFIIQDSEILNMPNEHGETPLIVAVRADKPAIVRDLLWNGAKVDALGCYCQEGQNTPALRTPLQVAAAEDKLHMIRILRENRADVFFTAPDGVNALQLATSNGHESITDHIRSAYISAIALVPEAQKETAKLKRGLEEILSIGETAKKFPVIPLPQRGNLNEKSPASTAATAITRDAIIEQAPSKATWSAIIKEMGTLRGVTYPLPPKWPEGSEVPHIDCPYCSEPLTRQQIKRAAWNRHVSEDILPYICFHEDCKTPDDLYRTSEELTKHFISEHGVPCWICDICTPDIEQEQCKIFETAQLWRDHLHYAHSQVILDTEFSMLAELNMQNMVPAVDCPLCDYATSEIKPNIDPHITRHIQQFSLRSLPWEARTEGDISKEPPTGKSSSARTSYFAKTNISSTSRETSPMMRKH